MKGRIMLNILLKTKQKNHLATINNNQTQKVVNQLENKITIEEIWHTMQQCINFLTKKYQVRQIKSNKWMRHQILTGESDVSFLSHQDLSLPDH